MTETLPSVTVIIPARDAAATLPSALRGISDQTYPRVVEVIVAAADAASADAASGAIVVDNPLGSTTAGLNLALAAASSDVIVRCDAHAVLPEDYVARAVDTLLRTGADAVGGKQVPIGETFWERAIAAAMTSPLGAGDARYRLGGEEGPAETVYLGVFRREVLERLGGYDEAFLRSQDYELNHRIIASGGVVWFDPELAVAYRPRGSLGDLARQYFRYGVAKRQMARKHPGSLRWRQWAAPVVVVSLAASLTLSFLFPWALLVPAGYATALLGAGMAATLRAGWAALLVPVALATMHLSWGAGFLWGRVGAGDP